MNRFTVEVYKQTKRIPRGRVATYGQIAQLAGKPRAARSVGFALHWNPEPGHIPCHRVVFSDGSLSRAFAFGGKDVQMTLLANEGITFLPDGRVDMERYAWNVGQSLTEK